jgi:histidinol-phosphate aminotransferase
MSFLDSIPEHIRNIQPYKAAKPIEDVEAELGIRVAKLEANENPFGPSPKAVAAMRRFLDHVERYPDDTGFHLRRRLAQAFNVSMDEIILGAGSNDIFVMAFHAMLTRDAEVLTSEGSFIVYTLLAQGTGVRFVRTPVKDFGFDLPAMAERITPHTRLICIANPNNPTGTIVRKREFSEFMKKVPDHVLVIMDQAYFEYVSDPEFPDAFEYLRSDRPILITRTFSKAYGLAGLRIGYGFAPAPVIETLNKVRMAFNVSSIAQVAATAALEDREHVEKTAASNRTELGFFYQELERRSIHHVKSSANFVLIEAGHQAQELEGAMLQKGVMVRSMGAWGFPTKIRISVGTHGQNEAFFKVFDEVR